MRATQRIKWEELHMRLNQTCHFNTNRYLQSSFLTLAPFWILMDIIIPKQLCKTALELLDYNLSLVEKVEGNSTILQDLDKRKHWGKKKNFLNFDKDKGQILPRGKKSPCNNNMWGQRNPEKPGSSLARKALECWSSYEPVGSPAPEAANSSLCNSMERGRSPVCIYGFFLWSCD